MKKLFFLSAIPMLMIACGNGPETKETTSVSADSTTKDTVIVDTASSDTTTRVKAERAIRK